MQSPQTSLRSKFGGLPWGLPLERWRRCQECGRLMSLLAQLMHDPPALDLGGPDHVLHLFQCQDPGCLCMDPGMGNDAVMVPVDALSAGLTVVPENEELGGCDAVMINGVVPPNLRLLVGELWIDGWEERDDGFDPNLSIDVFDYDKWIHLPESIVDQMFKSRSCTKMGGVPCWTANGPPEPLPAGYEFLFQLDTFIHFTGTPPTPDECGGWLDVTEYVGQGEQLRIKKQESFKPTPENRKPNAPWSVGIDNYAPGSFSVEITNFGSDGTAYVFINRQSKPAEVFWLWRR